MRSWGLSVVDAAGFEQYELHLDHSTLDQLGDYKVVIADAIEPTSDPNAVAPVARSTVWTGQAVSEEHASFLGWRQWDGDHGPGRPAAIVRVTLLP